MLAVPLLAAALAASGPDALPSSAHAALDGDSSAAIAPVAELPTPPLPLQLRIAFLPLASYGSTVGVQLGAGFLFYRAPEGGGLRRDWATLLASWATRGPRSVEVKGERLGVLGLALRPFWQVKYSSDDAAPYWGEGARLSSGGDPGAGSPPPEYRYQAVGPWLSLLVRAPLDGRDGPWSSFGRIRFRHLDVRFPGDALRAADPPGAGGGSLTTLHAGVLRDTRDDEVSPSRGLLADASVFGSPPLAGVSDHATWGVNVGARAYRELAPRLVLAARAIYDLKLGDVPFHERTQLEGLDYGEGLGGRDTVRGLARARLSGEEKMVANLELRALLWTPRPFGRSLEIGAAAGADAGRARQRGHSPLSAAGVFAGFRGVWDRAVVVRVDVGWARQGSAAYYVAFEDSF